MELIQKQLRHKIWTTIYNNKEGHWGACASVIDALYILHSQVMTPNDYCVLSKGHASLALYACLNALGKLSRADLDSYCLPDSIIGGHPNRNTDLGILFTTGSLGHGLPCAAGAALASPHKKFYVILGDGEMGEGSNWEAIQFIVQHNLKNVILVIDDNSSHRHILGQSRLPYVLPSMGLKTYVCHNGNDMGDLAEVFARVGTDKSDKPLAVYMKTIKGFGLSFTENNDAWHRRIPTEEEYKKGIKELYEY